MSWASVMSNRRRMLFTLADRLMLMLASSMQTPRKSSSHQPPPDMWAVMSGSWMTTRMASSGTTDPS